MVTYSPGMRLIIRNEEWMLRKVEQNSDDKDKNGRGITLFVVGISPLVKDYEAQFLVNLEKIDVVDPSKVNLVPDNSAHFIQSKLYLESQWRQRTPTDANIHIGFKAAMDVLPFQLEPAKMALEKPRQRILIADTVGLGKTMEAGILMSELIARGKGKRILVVTVKSMMTQFQKEIWNRFTIPLVRLDSNKIQKIRQEMPSNYNPFVRYDKTIISIDTLKRDIEYRTHLENSWWDIIVIDEAHNVAERGQHAQRARLAELLAQRSDSLIMLTATPHDGRAKSFASLMNMLDPTAIADPEHYTKEETKGLCIRRFKKDVANQLGAEYKKRKISVEECGSTETEEKAFSMFTRLKLNMDVDRTRKNGILFKTSLEKALFSSPVACIKSINERLKKLAKKLTELDNADDKKLIAEDVTQLTDLSNTLQQITPECFSRYTRLLELLKNEEYGWDVEKKDDRLVVFTERIETMKYVAAQLRKDLDLSEEVVCEMSGSMSDKEQQELVDKFGRREAKIRILVASDVASEGINLHHFCHRLIHFDLPWSLMVYQQRNGRIDRYGQTKQPDIRYMKINSMNNDIKGDMRILEILCDKQEKAQENIGDPADILGKYNQEDEEITVAQTMQNKGNIEEVLLKTEPEENFFDTLFSKGSKESTSTSSETQDQLPEEKIVTDEKSIFTDYEYLKQATNYLNGINTQEQCSIVATPNEGLELTLSPALINHCKKILPEEAKPQNNKLIFSADKETCMQDMQRSLQNNMDENGWPKIQYLWELHPIFPWLNDKVSLLYKRNEAPLLNIPSILSDDTVIALVSGIIPNKKSTPVIYEWFGVELHDGKVTEIKSVDQVAEMIHLRDEMQNIGSTDAEHIAKYKKYLPEIIAASDDYLNNKCIKYKEKMGPILEAQLNKIANLKQDKINYIQQDLFTAPQKDREKRKTDMVFDDYQKWVNDTVEIENKPYIKVLAILTGVQ